MHFNSNLRNIPSFSSQNNRIQPHSCSLLRNITDRQTFPLYTWFYPSVCYYAVGSLTSLLGSMIYLKEEKTASSTKGETSKKASSPLGAGPQGAPQIGVCSLALGAVLGLLANYIFRCKGCSRTRARLLIVFDTRFYLIEINKISTFSIRNINRWIGDTA